MGGGASSRVDVHARAERCWAPAAWPRVSGGALSAVVRRTRPRAPPKSNGASSCAVRRLVGPMGVGSYGSKPTIFMAAASARRDGGDGLERVERGWLFGGVGEEDGFDGHQASRAKSASTRIRFEHLGDGRREHLAAWKRRSSMVVFVCWRGVAVGLGES